MEPIHPEPSVRNLKARPFEFQNWPVYREAMIFAKRANKFCLGLPKTGNQSLGDQLRRASQSIPLNVAEGSSRGTSKDKINFLRISKGSVFECAAILDLAVEFGLLQQEDHQDLLEKLASLGRMLSGMIRHFERKEAS